MSERKSFGSLKNESFHFGRGDSTYKNKPET